VLGQWADSIGTVKTYAAPRCSAAGELRALCFPKPKEAGLWKTKIVLFWLKRTKQIATMLYNARE
jgi:hypothetical protein